MKNRSISGYALAFVAALLSQQDVLGYEIDTHAEMSEEADSGTAIPSFSKVRDSFANADATALAKFPTRKRVSERTNFGCGGVLPSRRSDVL